MTRLWWPKCDREGCEARAIFLFSEGPGGSDECVCAEHGWQRFKDGPTWIRCVAMEGAETSEVEL